MPAPKKSSVAPEIHPKTIGVVAGAGTLPAALVHACIKKDIEPFIIGFEGQTDPALIEDHNHLWTRLGAAGQIINTLHAHDIKDLVLIGAIRRPSLMELRPDLRTAEFFARIGLKALGDDGLLSAMRSELEKEGFTLHGLQEFAEDLLMQEGEVGAHKPGKADWVDINHGIEISRELGRMDIGQAVIIQQGIVLGVEAAEGTDELIKRCKVLHRKGKGGVLIKTCKPQQDTDFDLPTIGPETIKNAAEAGLAGIVTHAGHSLLVEPEKVAQLADQHKMFVIGVDIKTGTK